MGKKISDWHHIYKGKEALLIAFVILLFFLLGMWLGYSL